MAVVTLESKSKDTVYMCDGCGKTAEMSLSSGIKLLSSGWQLLEGDRCLCPDCLSTIIDAWYNQKNVSNFQLQGSAESVKSRKRKKAIA